MKKSVLLAIAFVLTLGIVGAQAVATDVAWTETIPDSLVKVGTISANVLIGYNSSADNSGYVLGTYHKKGTRTYGSSSGDPALYYSTATAATLPAAPAGTASADFDSATWTKI